MHIRILIQHVTSICGLIWSTVLAAQNADFANQENFQVHIFRTTASVVVDGILDEDVWKKSEKATGQWMWQPTDVGRPKRNIDMRCTYNDTYIFFSFTGYDSGRHLIKTLKRDAEIGQSDGIGLVLDPQNKHQNGYVFILNTANVQAEDVVSSAGTVDVDWSWDNAWLSAVKHYTDKWTMEIAIPFKALRYSRDKTDWGINFGQGDIRNNEYSLWAKSTGNKLFIDLGSTGKLIWDAPPPAVRGSATLIPYTKASVEKEMVAGTHHYVKPSAGVDMRINVGSAMRADVTINPDFSQVEVDRQVTNLTRFNIFFPEKRQFFLENADLFSAYGAPTIRPFYSRTIGLDKEGNPIPIIAGARVSGNVTPLFRVGLMNIQTAGRNGFAPQNYTALSVNQGILKRSVLKAYLLNRQAIKTKTEKEPGADAFSRNAGMQLNYLDAKGIWMTQAGYNISLKPGVSGGNVYYQLVQGYNSRNLAMLFAWDHVSSNYYADMGFIDRVNNYDAISDSFYHVGFGQLTNNNKYTLYPEKGAVSQFVTELANTMIWNPAGVFIERRHDLKYTVNFRNTSSVTAGANVQEVQLQYATKLVSNANASPIPPAQYNFSQISIQGNTDKRHMFYIQAGIQAGKFYNGHLLQQTTSFNFRRQPWGNFAIDFEYDRLRFPSTYGRADLYLAGSRAEISFSTKVFWTTFLQYNTQLDNFNINSRFQWRFRPMSDIYIVYTDNYFTSAFLKSKARGIILKMNWWLGL